MILYNVNWAGRDDLQHIRILNNKIVSIVSDKEQLTTAAKEPCLRLDHAVAFPGLINSHDHLDFNLFPALGNGIYKNYMDWGNDIHRQNKESIDAVLKVPQALRIRWGIYKNLLNGITTVVHHGSYLPIDKSIIHIFQQAQSIHSIGLGENWKLKMILPIKRGPLFVIHIGEGTDNAAYREINELIKWNIFNKKIIGVHGVAMDAQQASHFHGLVWCPASNYFLLNKTAAINRLKRQTKILFGTDSTLSSSWNLWKHLRFARKQKMVTDKELFDMLTHTAAAVWKLKASGNIEINQPANLVIAKKDKRLHGWDAFYALNPEDVSLVICDGNIRLIAAELYEQMLGTDFALKNFYSININGHTKYVWGDLPALITEIRKYYPSVSLPVS